MKVLIKTDGVAHTICPACKETAVVKTLVIQESKPHKRVTFTECKGCGLNETSEEDIEKLKYGVRITCDFTDKSKLPQNLKRMAFINHNGEVSLLKDGSEVLSFKSTTSNIDCVEGVLLRAEEMIEGSAAGDKELKGTLKKLKSLKESGFKMVVTDNTGYSKVCPENMEYRAVQDMSFSELNAKGSGVVHEEIEKKQSQ